MRIEIAHSDIIHTNLRQIYEAFKERGTVGVYSGTNSDGSRDVSFPGYGFNANSINLPAPLKSMGFGVKSRGEFYTALIPIIASGRTFLEGLSDKFAEAFTNREGQTTKNDFSWFPVDEAGTGYIIKDKVPIISVSRFSTERGSLDSGRAIAIGDLGAEPRKIEGDHIEFCSGISLLEKVANIYVKCIYEINGQKEKSDQDITLFLDCII